MSATFRRLGFFVLGAVLACVPLAIGGCAATVGSQLTQDGKSVDLTNGSPTTLSLTDKQGQWLANGVGPARYTSFDKTGLQTFQTGSTPRDILYSLPDGSQLMLSSGTDWQGKGLKYTRADGTTLELAEFGSSASEPLKALEKINELVMQYFAARDQASRDAIIAEIQMIGAVIPEVTAKIVEALKKVPLPVP